MLMAPFSCLLLSTNECSQHHGTMLMRAHGCSNLLMSALEPSCAIMRVHKHSWSANKHQEQPSQPWALIAWYHDSGPLSKVECGWWRWSKGKESRPVYDNLWYWRVLSLLSTIILLQLYLVLIRYVRQYYHIKILHMYSQGHHVYRQGYHIYM